MQWKARRPADAIATLEPITRTAAPDADAMSLLAAAYESNKEVPEALSALRRALEIHPGDERLYLDLGAFCLEHNAIPLGIEVLEVGAGNVPQSARIRAMLGILEARGGFTEKAEATFQSAERMAPDASLGSVGLAVMLMHLNAADSAVDMLRAQLPRHPDDVPMLTTLACRWRRKRVPFWRRSGPLPGEPFGVSLSLFSEVLFRTAWSRQGRAVVGRGEANP